MSAPDPAAEVRHLRHWKAEALEVIDGLQELGRALDLTPGIRATGYEALAAVEALVAERDALRQQPTRQSIKTGGGGGQWVEYDSPKPPAVTDPDTHWGSPPPTMSARCAWWMRQIANGWRPSRTLRNEDRHSASEWFGVWLWEYQKVLEPAMRLKPHTTAAPVQPDTKSSGAGLCPTCGPTGKEPHPRVTGVIRCTNCKEWLNCSTPTGKE